MSSIRKAKQIFAAALEAAKPEKAMRRFVRPSLAHEFPRLYIDDRKYDMRNFDKVMVVGAGKATVNMLTGLLQVYPTTRESSKDELTAASSFPPIYGKIITKYDHYSEQARKLINISMQRQRECFDMTSSADAVSDLKMEVDEAGHPIPDECGLSSTREILHMANLADARTLVITLISGGGSSLLVSPVESVSLQVCPQNLASKSAPSRINLFCLLLCCATPGACENESVIDGMWSRHSGNKRGAKVYISSKRR